jgi:hypothetical protein
LAEKIGSLHRYFAIWACGDAGSSKLALRMVPGVQLAGAGYKCNRNVTMSLAEYYRNHPMRSLISIVLAAVLIGLQIAVIAESIENDNDHVIDTQIAESIRNDAGRGKSHK